MTELFGWRTDLPPVWSWLSLLLLAGVAVVVAWVLWRLARQHLPRLAHTVSQRARDADARRAGRREVVRVVALPPSAEAQEQAAERTPGREPLPVGGSGGGLGMRLVQVLIGAALLVVLSLPVALSAQDIVAWASSQHGLGLSPGWAGIVWGGLDAAALMCALMVVLAAWRGESGGAFTLLVWVFAGASAFANWRYGTRPDAPRDAVWFFPAMSIAGPLLFDITTRRIRRWVQSTAGRYERPLPRFRGARWLVAPAETALAWRLSVTEGYERPAAAVTAARVLRPPRRHGQVIRSAPPGEEPTRARLGEGDRPQGDLDADRALVEGLDARGGEAVAEWSRLDVTVRGLVAEARRELRQQVTTDLAELRDQVIQQAATAAAAQTVAQVDARVREAVAQEVGARRDQPATVGRIGRRHPRALQGHSRPAHPARPAPSDDEQATARAVARGILAREGRRPSRRRLAREAGVTEHAARTALDDLDDLDDLGDLGDAQHHEQPGGLAQPPPSTPAGETGDHGDARPDADGLGVAGGGDLTDPDAGATGGTPATVAEDVGSHAGAAAGHGPPGATAPPPTGSLTSTDRTTTGPEAGER